MAAVQGWDLLASDPFHVERRGSPLSRPRRLLGKRGGEGAIGRQAFPGLGPPCGRPGEDGRIDEIDGRSLV